MFGRTLRCISALLSRPVVGGVLLLAISGCQPKLEQIESDKSDDTTSAASKIPLRVWVVAPEGELELFERQWLANSEQPLELRTLSMPELLQAPSSQCDVLLYPANLMGELIKREWIIRLPSSLSQPGATDSEESSISSTPAAWRAQADYGGETMGVSLGCAVPVFVASAALVTDDGSASWEQALAQLHVEANESPAFSFEAGDVDAEALVDRFLAIVASLSERDPGYGMLFDLQSMRARLADAEYRQAASLLAALAAQPEGLASVLGSHSTAWTWGATRDTAALAIAAPAQLSTQAAGITSGNIVELNLDSAATPTAESLGAENGATDVAANRPRIAWWSTGAGLVASQSSSCRQTNQANAFLRWLQIPATRGMLAGLLPGVESSSPAAGSQTLSWKAQRELSQQVTTKGLALEPRLPSSHLYRQALAAELQQFLSGQKNAQGALQDAARSWDAITEKAGQSQRRNYEQSLNL